MPFCPWQSIQPCSSSSDVLVNSVYQNERLCELHTQWCLRTEGEKQRVYALTSRTSSVWSEVRMLTVTFWPLERQMSRATSSVGICCVSFGRKKKREQAFPSASRIKDNTEKNKALELASHTLTYFLFSHPFYDTIVSEHATKTWEDAVTPGSRLESAVSTLSPCFKAEIQPPEVTLFTVTQSVETPVWGRGSSTEQNRTGTSAKLKCQHLWIF